MQEINELLEKIKILKMTHPKIYALWKSYLILKRENIEKLKIKCDRMLQICESEKEPSQEMLFMLTILNITD